MSILAFLVGATLAIGIGWCALTILEWRTPVLGFGERIAWSAIVGPTLLTFMFFVLNTSNIIAFTRTQMLLSALIVVVALGICVWRWKLVQHHRKPEWHGSSLLPRHRFAKYALLLLLGWSALKVLTGSINLISTPTYWDDAFNNWNMRGKVFMETQELALELPGGNDIVIGKEGVNSYPPSVPLMKTWLAVLAGTWSEGLVNSMHGVWYIALLTCFFFLLRRKVDLTVSLIGVCALVSLPLVLIQGLNPYADVYVAGHLLLSLGALWLAASEQDAKHLRTWLLLSATVMCAGVFTKNEVLLLYLPIYVLLFAWTVFLRIRAHVLTKEDVVRTTAFIVLIGLALIAPWLFFKWANGLTFGNAKSVSDQTISLGPDSFMAMRAILFFLTNEPNFLLLPLIFPLVILASGKKVWRGPMGILIIFVLAAFCEQSAIYILTPLATEAINQTGLGRGFVQLAPLVLLFVMTQGWELLKIEH